MTDRPIHPASPLPEDPHLSSALSEEAIDRLASSGGAAVRLLADGELDAARLGTTLDGVESLSDRLAHELQLRESIARVMGADRAPESLRQAVLARFRAEADRGAHSPDQAQPHGVAAEHPPLAMGGRTRSQSFWNRAAGWMAIAAVLALAGLGVFGGLRAFNNQQTDGLNPEFRQNLVAFVTSEHRASNPDCSIASSKFEAKCVDEADSVIRATLGGMPRELCRKLRALESDGYTFVGVGRCGVPGEGASVHVLLLTPGGERASLFVQVRTPEVNIRSSCRYTSERCRKSGSQMVVWRSDEHIFYFYTADESARARVADAFGVPRANRAL